MLSGLGSLKGTRNSPSLAGQYILRSADDTASPLRPLLVEFPTLQISRTKHIARLKKVKPMGVDATSAETTSKRMELYV